MSALTAFRQITPAQLGFLNKLRTERGYDALDMNDLGEVSVRKASEMIDDMKATPKTESPVTAAKAELVPGVYRKDGQIFKVKPARSSDRLFAHQLDSEGTFNYVGLASRFVSLTDKMTLEQAKEYGAAYGICVACGRLLTNETSIEAGIGPVCRKQF